MKKIMFSVPAKEYFDVDAERLEEVEEGDWVDVTVDFENQTTDYVWYPKDGDPAHFDAFEDDF